MLFSCVRINFSFTHATTEMPSSLDCALVARICLKFCCHSRLPSQVGTARNELMSCVNTADKQIYVCTSLITHAYKKIWQEQQIIKTLYNDGHHLLQLSILHIKWFRHHPQLFPIFSTSISNIRGVVVFFRPFLLHFCIMAQGLLFVLKSYKSYTRVNINSLIPDLCNASGSRDRLLPCLAWPGVNWKFSLLLLFFHLKYWPTFDIFTAYTSITALITWLCKNFGNTELQHWVHWISQHFGNGSIYM